MSDKGAFTSSGGRFGVNLAKAKAAVRDLAGELLTIEATGDYGRAKKILNDFAVLRPDLKSALDGLKDIPTDIYPSGL